MKQLTVIDETKPDDLIFLDWLNTYVENGQRPAEIAGEFIERVINEGVADVFLRQYARDIVSNLWRSAASASRHRFQQEDAGSGARRFSLTSLGTVDSVYDALYSVNGEWVNLGDMTERHCRAVRARYEQNAQGNYRMMLFFDAVAERLNGEEAVRSKFTEDELEAMLKESESWKLPAQ